MTEKERFLRTMRYQDVDRRPLYLVGIWGDTLARWHQEGLPPYIKSEPDIHKYLGLETRSIGLRNLNGLLGPYPKFEQRTISEDDEVRIFVDDYGRTVRDFRKHTTLPEWLEFPVKDRATLQRFLDEHYSVDDLDERFDQDWEQRISRPDQGHELNVLDGGCYYWTLRSISGVEVASYLFYDAPDLVDELFERYLTIVMESMRRGFPRAPVNVIGFGEDIAFKTGTLISPDMFRKFILPRYRKALEYAHGKGVDVTLYDSDGDLRPFIPDYLDVGINGLFPCEIAAGMDPVDLRRQYGTDLRMVGAIDKRQVAKGPEAIDAQMQHVRPLIEEGGFVPAIDHTVPADVSFDNYRYFIDKLKKLLEL